MTDRELPMLPWFPKDFATATAAWTFAEASLYRCLIDAQWLTGPLPNDPRRLARIAKCDQATFDDAWPTVRTKFDIVDGCLINKRLEEHRAEAMRRKLTAAANGSKGGKASVKARLNRGLSDAQATVVAKSNPPSPSPSIPEEIGPSAPDFSDEEESVEDLDRLFLFNAFLPEAGGRQNASRLGGMIKRTRGGASVCAEIARDTLKEKSRKEAIGEAMDDPFAYFAGMWQPHDRKRLRI